MVLSISSRRLLRILGYQPVNGARAVVSHDIRMWVRVVLWVLTGRNRHG
jgi:hypothetical protein